MSVKTVLITGVAGFIGMHTAQRCLEKGYRVVGLDNLNNYYAISLKQDRLRQINGHASFLHFAEMDVADHDSIDELFSQFKPQVVIHLAAQAGVRYSIENPQAYVSSNVNGFVSIAESCKKHRVEHLIYASSSSVYGNSQNVPFSEQHIINQPVSVYAATKAANELLANVYSHQYGLKCTGLRFFTVYGPWGRPDMAPMLFANAISKGKPLKLFNGGDHERDFTYVDDIVSGIIAVMEQSSDVIRPLSRVYNIGASKPVHLGTFLSIMEKAINKKAIITLAPMQSGDVKTTYADVSLLQAETGYSPTVELSEGIDKFIAWFKGYYAI